MNTEIKKWGHSLVLGIPPSLADEAGLQAGTTVDVTLVGGKLVVTLQPTALTLERLLAGITPDNCHAETEW